MTRRKDLYFGSELEHRYAERRSTQNPSAIINLLAARYETMITDALTDFSQDEIELVVAVLTDSGLTNLPARLVGKLPDFVAEYVTRNPYRADEAKQLLADLEGNYADCLALVEGAERIIYQRMKEQ